MMKSRRILVVEYESFDVLASSNTKTLSDKAFLSDNDKQSSLGFSMPRFSLLDKSRNDSLPPESSYGYPYDIGARFNPSMSIALLVLLGILVFMGIFSIYVRQCTSDEDETGNSRMGGSGSGRMRASQGLDESIIETFSLIRYSSVKCLKQGKHAQECPVCLSEFEDDETLRLLPTCRHAFHPDCIDMWLYSHTTCPLCRCSLLPEPHGTVQEPGSDMEALPQQTGAPSQETDQIVVVIGARNAGQDRADNQGRGINEVNSSDAGLFTCRTIAGHARVYNEHSTSATTNSPIVGIMSCLRPQEKRSQNIRRSHSTGHSLVSLGGNAQHPSEVYISIDDQHVMDFTEAINQSSKRGLHRSTSYAAICHKGSPGLSHHQASVNDREKLWTYPSSIEDARPCSNPRLSRGQGFTTLSETNFDPRISSDRLNVSLHSPIFFRTFSEGTAPYFQQPELASTTHDINLQDVKAFMQSFKKGFNWLRGRDKNMASISGSGTSRRTSRNAGGGLLAYSFLL